MAEFDVPGDAGSKSGLRMAQDGPASGDGSAGLSTAAAGVADYFSRIKHLALSCDTELRERRRDRATNELLFAELSGNGYESSYLNPDYAAKRLGVFARPLCVWYMELRGIVPFTYEEKLRDITAILETTIQLYNAFEQNTSETDSQNELIAELSDIIYSYVYDYTDEITADAARADLCPEDSFALDIVMNADLTDTGENSYIYSFGEYVTDEELGVARLLNTFSGEKIARMARAYTDGYIRGFAMTGKDISKKSTVGLVMPLGFERFTKEAVRQFNAAGLKCTLARYPVHLINKKLSGNIKPGFYGASNPQMDYDHKEDLAFVWGDKLKSRRLSALKKAYGELANEAAVYSGRACVEIFGKKGAEPVPKASAPAFTERQRALSREYTFKSHEIISRFIPDEETSFTIIAWPTPSVAHCAAVSGVGDIHGVTHGVGTERASAIGLAEAGSDFRYREIFDKIVDINTLPLSDWQAAQQALCDALDRAEYVEVKGRGENRTDMKVRLHRLSDPEHETNFENCLADVNIPAGEVFTSPVLKGTSGRLHVGYVYIGGCLFKDLEICFEDGRVADYSCAGFDTDDKARAHIRKIIFGGREGLPIGEFAIGTNTVAYAAARRFSIEDRLPVLIAEKTGPHFAVGDTCYSYEEDLTTYNPDGKRITARENECSALRHTEPEKAYFNVHTDITIPYEELGSITAVLADGERIGIISDGRFTLPGTGVLNEALD